MPSDTYASGHKHQLRKGTIFGTKNKQPIENVDPAEPGGPVMLKTIGLLSAWFILVSATLAHAADIGRGKLLAERWCAACHLVSKNQPKATDQAPPFMGSGRLPGFDENKLAFLLLSPHPNMPALSLDRSEVADLAAYIHSL